MKNHWLPLLLNFFLLCLVPQAQAGGSLKFGITTSNSPPLLYQLENQNMPMATGGFIYEVTVAIAEALSEDYSIVTIPRGRTLPELISGNIDLLCHNSSSWARDYKNTIYWSNPLFKYSNILVGKKPIPFTKVEDIANTTVGTVFNFVYPSLNSNFKNKKVIRDDGPSAALNVNKLLGDRLDYVIMSEIEFNYYKTKYPQLERSSFSLGKTDIQCSLSKKSSLSLKKLNETIDKLTRAKTLHKIKERYLDPKTIPEPVTYGLNANDSPPFIFFDKNEDLQTIKGGVFFDLALEIGKKIKRPISLILMPRVRLDSDLSEGKIDLVCYDAEAWAGKYAKNYFWSVPIAKHSNLIASLKTTKQEDPPKSLEDLKGKTLGTVLHFVYPSLDPYFKNGSIHREDADSGAANLAKLSFQRVPYIVVNNLEYAYYRKTTPNLQRSTFEFDTTDVKCAVSKRAHLKVEDINTAINELSKSGDLPKIFSR